MKTQTYDDFSRDYDRFVNWDERLKVEMPFLKETLHTSKQVRGHSPRVLDAGCGTGMHAIALATEGFQAAGADISGEMIRQAKTNTEMANKAVEFKPAGFGELAKAFSDSAHFPFDGLICLGNSLPHMLSKEAISGALADMANCLCSGGVLLIQNRNFDAVMKEKQRWLGTQSYREGEKEWVFLRFYDFDADGLITFNIVRLFRQGDSPWSEAHSTTRLYPLLQDTLIGLIADTGFESITCFGKMDNEPFNPAASGNLVVRAVNI